MKLESTCFSKFKTIFCGKRRNSCELEIVEHCKKRGNSCEVATIENPKRVMPPSALKKAGSLLKSAEISTPKRAHFAPTKPLIQVEPDLRVEPPAGKLDVLYQEVLHGQSRAEKIDLKEVEYTNYIRFGKIPDVYCTDIDLVSHAASIVDSDFSGIDIDRVMVLFDFNGRNEREMSIVKGDVIIVLKRQATWIFGRKIDRTLGDAQSHTLNSFTTFGWIPIAFVTKLTNV